MIKLMSWNLSVLPTKNILWQLEIGNPVILSLPFEKNLDNIQQSWQHWFLTFTNFCTTFSFEIGPPTFSDKNDKFDVTVTAIWCLLLIKYLIEGESISSCNFHLQDTYKAKI